VTESFPTPSAPDTLPTFFAGQAAHGIGPWIWWYNLERIMAAVEDLSCLEFLD
jgi:hypothetical protein